MRIPIYSLADEHIKAIQNYLEQQLGLQVKKYNAVRFALNSAKPDSIDYDTIRILHSQRLLSCRSVRHYAVPKQQKETILYIMSLLPGVQDVALTATAIVVSVALALNAQRSPTKGDEHEVSA